jgi:hypothetical protein
MIKKFGFAIIIWKGKTMKINVNQIKKISVGVIFRLSKQQNFKLKYLSTQHYNQQQ